MSTTTAATNATAVPAEEWNWLDFFRSAGIPEGQAESYADVFIDNRMTRGMLADLDKDILQGMGVAVMGDVICILKQARLILENDARAKKDQLRAEAKQKGRGTFKFTPIEYHLRDEAPPRKIANIVAAAPAPAPAAAKAEPKPQAKPQAQQQQKPQQQQAQKSNQQQQQRQQQQQQQQQQSKQQQQQKAAQNSSASILDRVQLKNGSALDSATANAKKPSILDRLK